MSLHASELAQVVDELNVALRSAVVQRAFAPLPQLWYLQLRQPGRSVLLCLSAEPGASRISVASERFSPTREPAAIQGRLRKCLVGTALREIRLVAPSQVVLELGGKDASFWISASLAGRDSSLSLLTERPPLEAGPAPLGTASRLHPKEGARFPFAEAAEELLAGEARSRRVEQIRRRLMSPLKVKLARVERTLPKVAAEAARGPVAETHRSAGELLSRNLERIPRGVGSIRLTDYTAQGPREVEVALRPELGPKEQAAWHFHQYRRLLRGSAHAARRLEELRAEKLSCEAALRALDDASEDDLLSRPVAAGTLARRSQPTARPYKEYLSSTGRRIWVGRSAKSNEVLTFRIARPHDLWLHARGASGSHVVVPLDKNETAGSDLLVDAAHLALHHSQLKGEPRGEVAYTQAKYVKRQKGATSGTVTVTREKTLVLRVEPDRLKRLLGAQTAASSLQPQKLAHVLRSGRSK
jgi:predicted ribosome quality control (RQC) complex YloA/Tae2 family protein